MSIDAKIDDREARAAAYRSTQWKIGFGVMGISTLLGTAFGTALHYSMPVIAQYYDVVTQYFAQ